MTLIGATGVAPTRFDPDDRHPCFSATSTTSAPTPVPTDGRLRCATARSRSGRHAPHLEESATASTAERPDPHVPACSLYEERLLAGDMGCG
jgi:hypothetical protein